MATASLLEPISVLFRSTFCPLIWNPLFRRSQTLLPFPPIKTHGSIRISPNSSFNPSVILLRSHSSPSSHTSKEEGAPFGGIVTAILEAPRALQKPAAAVVLLGFLLTVGPFAALAASGGRMGGSNFSYSSSSHSSSTSYSAPSTSSSHSWSSFSYGDLSDSSYSYSIAHNPPLPVGVTMETRWSGFVLMFGLAAIIMLVGVWSDRKDERSSITGTAKLTVHKIQVGLLGMARSLQKDLDRIAETADTSTSEGLHYVLTETALALLRHPDCCISAYSSVDVKRSIEDGEKRFNQLSIEERGKFDEETLVNVNNVKKQKTTSQRSKGFSNEYIVITILAAVEGVHKLPIINGSSDLKEALQKLGSIPSNKTLAVEVLWTPQNENDTLSERELLEDYPLLRPL